MKNVATSVFMVLMSVFGFNQVDSISNLPHLLTECDNETNGLFKNIMLPASDDDYSITTFYQVVAAKYSVGKYKVDGIFYESDNVIINDVWVVIVDHNDETLLRPLCLLENFTNPIELEFAYDEVFNYLIGLRDKK
jgi:hypothetical protein